MNSPEPLRIRLARIKLTTVDGQWWRHTSRAVPPDQFLRGSTSGGGRWAVRDGNPILYLGRPRESVVIEAYRHLVDGTELDGPEFVQPRQWLHVQVQIHRVLDLTGQANRGAVGLNRADLLTQIGHYDRCRQVARAAAQLGNITAILAPAATGRGQTLAITPHLLEPRDALELLDAEFAPLPADPRTPTSAPAGDVDTTSGRPGDPLDSDV